MALRFAQRGVAHYVGTYARIRDGSDVVNFALCFYETLFARGESVGAALRLARLNLRLHHAQSEERERGQLQEKQQTAAQFLEGRVCAQIFN